MNKEKIADRLKQLEADRDQVRASLVAYEGAIQDCNYWLTQIETGDNVENNTNEPS